MPTYEYECQKCGKKFEAFQKMTDKPLTKCPDKKCKGIVKKLISRGAGFILKGSGFYATDYRKDSYKKKEREDSHSSCSSCPKKESGCGK